MTNLSHDCLHRSSSCSDSETNMYVHTHGQTNILLCSGCPLPQTCLQLAPGICPRRPPAAETRTETGEGGVGGRIRAVHVSAVRGPRGEQPEAETSLQAASREGAQEEDDETNSGQPQVSSKGSTATSPSCVYSHPSL